jgi:hypothetical protein
MKSVLFRSSSLQNLIEITTSTPHPTYKPRVNFHSIESLAISALNTSSLTPHSSPFSIRRHGKLHYLILLTMIQKEKDRI